MAENQLAIIVKESGLAPTKAKEILENFKNYFDIAAEWEKKSKTIMVTNADQKVDMQMARTGRLFLRQKRIAIENSRKSLKEQALREGKAIDGIANVLKALIVPIEEYLEKQEKFVEIKVKEKEEQMRIEVAERIEKERIAEEEAEAKERERIRIENKKLIADAEIRERRFKKQKEKSDAAHKKEVEARQKEIEEAAEEKREQEKEARLEREKQEEKLANERAEADKARKKQAEKLEKERKEKERLEALLKSQVECPKCGHKFQPNKK